MDSPHHHHHQQQQQQQHPHHPHLVLTTFGSQQQQQQQPQQNGGGGYLQSNGSYAEQQQQDRQQQQQQPAAAAAAASAQPQQPGGYPYQQQQRQQSEFVSNITVGSAVSGRGGGGSGGGGGGLFKRGGARTGPNSSSHYNNWDATKIYNNMTQYTTNPVGALQERFQSRGVIPEYRVVQAEGASHCPTFSYQVLIGDMVAMGSGSSKKQAKHTAARAMMDKLDGRAPAQDGVQPLPPVSEMNSINIPAVATAAPGGDAKTETGGDGDGGGTESSSTGGGSVSGGGGGGVVVATGNTIGKLQELCVARGLPMPIYDLTAVEGQPHMRHFDIIVKVGGQRTVKGEGTSKKDAKRDAADKMIKLIVDGGGDKVEEEEEEEQDKDGNSNNSMVELSKEDEELANKVAQMKIDPLTKKHSIKIQQFYRNLQDTSGGKLFLLHRTSLKSATGANYVRLLNELAAEQKFEVTHVEIEELTDDGQIQYLVQLSSMPVTVCYGTGRDMESAKQAAARTALNYLKMMTKKTAKNTNAAGGSGNEATTKNNRSNVAAADGSAAAAAASNGK